MLFLVNVAPDSRTQFIGSIDIAVVGVVRGRPIKVRNGYGYLKIDTSDSFFPTIVFTGGTAQNTSNSIRFSSSGNSSFCFILGY